MRHLIIPLILSLLAGCAFRTEQATKPESPESYTDLYSRNYLVAAPTASANALCGAAGGWFIASQGGDAYASLGGVLIGAHVCGAIVGLPFIPLSYLCEENPWYVEEDGGFNMNWSCDGSSTYSP